MNLTNGRNTNRSDTNEKSFNYKVYGAIHDYSKAFTAWAFSVSCGGGGFIWVNNKTKFEKRGKVAYAVPSEYPSPPHFSRSFLADIAVVWFDFMRNNMLYYIGGPLSVVLPSVRLLQHDLHIMPEKFDPNRTTITYI